MSAERWVWDQSHTYRVNVRQGSARVEHDMERRVWQVHYVGHDRTCVLMETDSQVAAIIYAERVFR